MMRRGFSLLEVMFSIGVIAVGLLGIIIIVPVALRQVGKGRVADVAARTASTSGTMNWMRFMPTFSIGPPTQAGMSPLTCQNLTCDAPTS